MGNHTGTVKRFAGVTGPAITLVVASVMLLFASLTSLVLAVYLQGRTKKTRKAPLPICGRAQPPETCSYVGAKYRRSGFVPEVKNC